MLTNQSGLRQGAPQCPTHWQGLRHEAPPHNDNKLINRASGKGLAGPPARGSRQTKTFGRASGTRLHNVTKLVGPPARGSTMPKTLAGPPARRSPTQYQQINQWGLRQGARRASSTRLKTNQNIGRASGTRLHNVNKLVGPPARGSTMPKTLAGPRARGSPTQCQQIN